MSKFSFKDERSLTIRIKRKKTYWAVHCIELNRIVFGNTLDVVFKMLLPMVQEYSDALTVEAPPEKGSGFPLPLVTFPPASPAELAKGVVVRLRPEDRT